MISTFLNGIDVFEVYSDLMFSLNKGALFSIKCDGCDCWCSSAILEPGIVSIIGYF